MPQKIVSDYFVSTGDHISPHELAALVLLSGLATTLSTCDEGFPVLVNYNKNQAQNRVSLCTCHSADNCTFNYNRGIPVPQCVGLENPVLRGGVATVSSALLNLSNKLKHAHERGYYCMFPDVLLAALEQRVLSQKNIKRKGMAKKAISDIKTLDYDYIKRLKQDFPEQVTVISAQYAGNMTTYDAIRHHTEFDKIKPPVNPRSLSGRSDLGK
ncbi:hypothetical protein FACS1894202_07560 [Clostridia bacterium]|nr:hypothetical protein FACS1894202_07560 [Clostridia bacterium]